MILQQNSTDVRVNYFYDEDSVIQPIDVLYERHIINPNGLIQLKNIPSPLHTVFTIIRRNGTSVIQYNKVESVVNQYDFIADYINGILTFHSSQVGKEIQISYTNSIGKLNISADVIFTNIDNQGNIVQTLGTMIDEGRSVLSDLSVLGGASKVITELRGYMESLINLKSQIIEGSEVSDELKSSTDMANESNSVLNSTIDSADSKINELNNWVESHGDIVELNDRVDIVEDSLSNVSIFIDNNLLKSVKDFGAIGNGIADDTISIENCINYCIENSKTTYFPNGTYCISKSILPTPTKDHPNKNKLVSIVGESHLGVALKKIGNSQFDYGIDFKWCNKVYAENLSSPDFTFNTLDNSAYWQGDTEWALALKDKDFYLKNLIYTGEGGNQSYYLYINSPSPKNYERYSDGNYAKYPLEITNGSGYNAININNFSTNADGSIGSPQDNSAIGIVDRTINSTGVVFIDMIGARSFERYVKRDAEICSEIRPLTVWEINHNGHIAIGCSVDTNDPVAIGWEGIKLRDKSPAIALFDANDNNKKATLQMLKQTWGEELNLKINGKGISIIDNETNGAYNGFRYTPIINGLKIQNDNGVLDGLIFGVNGAEQTLFIDENGNPRIGVSSQSNSESARLQYALGSNSGNRPIWLTNNWRDVGFQYFDTSLNKPIWWNGTTWVDSLGTIV